MKEFFTIKNEANETAVIDINGYIGRSWWEDQTEENSLQRIAKALKDIKDLNAKAITVNIFSLGGDVHHAFAIHDALVAHPATITTNIIGFCASAATIIAMAGEVRKMSDNSLFLIHKCMTSAWGCNENDLQALLESNKLVDDRIKNLYIKAGIAAEKIDELMNADNGYGKWITAAEAHSFGFITEITQLAQAASVPADILAKAKLPAVPTGYEALIANEQNLWDRIENKIKDLFTSHNSQFTQNQQTKNTTDMKNLFPLITAFFAFADDKQFDAAKGETLNQEQLAALEAKLAEITALQTDKTALQAEITTLQSEKASLEAKVAEQKTLLDNAKLLGNLQGAKDTNPNEEKSYYDKMKEDPYYQDLARELGKEL